METSVHFRETQRYSQPWLWGLLAVRPALIAVGWLRGNRSRGDLLRELASFLGVALLLGSTRLTTEVRDDGLYVKFEPFHRSFRRIPFADITDVQEAGYSPLGHGGWGLRWTPGGVAFTVSGKTGVRFERADETAVYVGSNRPDELVAAVQTATEREL